MIISRQDNSKTIWNFLKLNKILRNFNLRIHKFFFQWDLVLYLSLCMLSLLPFCFTGDKFYAIIPISIWILYNVLFLMGSRRVDSVLPGDFLFLISYFLFLLYKYTHTILQFQKHVDLNFFFFF